MLMVFWNMTLVRDLGLGMKRNSKSPHGACQEQCLRQRARSEGLVEYHSQKRIQFPGPSRIILRQGEIESQPFKLPLKGWMLRKKISKKIDFRGGLVSWLCSNDHDLQFVAMM